MYVYIIYLYMYVYKYFSQLLDVHRVSDVRQIEIHKLSR
jgi:hypothetical protein